MSNVHPVEVVGCGSETQLQVGENLNKLGKYPGMNNLPVVMLHVSKKNGNKETINLCR